MHTLLPIIIIGHFLLFIYEDFKYRAISAFPLVTLGVSTIWYSRRLINTELLISNIGVELLFLGVQALLLIAYFSFKEKKLDLLLDKKLGSGDVLFFVVILPLFSPVHFVFVYVSGLIFSLIVSLLVSKKEGYTIPLAGLLSLFLTVIFLASIATNHILCSDEKLIELLGY